MNHYFTFLHAFIKYRISSDLGTSESSARPVFSFTRHKDAKELTRFIKENKLSEDEIIIVLMALVPHVLPSFFSALIAGFFPNGGEFPEFGGLKGKNHRGILPTGETALYVLAGNMLPGRMEAKKVFDPENLVIRLGIIQLGNVPAGEPKIAGQLTLDQEYVELFTTGSVVKPSMSQDFPAERISTQMDWENLVLNSKTREEINEIETWLKYNDVLLNEWNMKHIIKPGYRVMFYGPPGTGKTLTASLLGKYTKRDVYRIDLSMVVSKYIGETEKNLSSLFNKAANKDWILFFDEADAIFGKRTNVRDAHDKYANQEVSYLLQRIEAHPGLVILASNLKDNIDAAFTRRFQSIIEFDLPNVEERIQLWKNNVPKSIKVAKDVSFRDISEAYDITGANIVNVIQYACLQQLEAKSKELELDFLIKGIHKEYTKEGKII